MQLIRLEGFSRAAVVPRLRGEGSPSDNVLTIAFIIAAAAVAAQAVTSFANAVALNRGIGALNADSDTSLWAWAGIGVEFTAAYTAALLAVLQPHHRARWLVLALVVAFLSADDMLQWHERASTLVTSIGPIDHAGRLIWPIIFLPALSCTFVLLLTSAARVRPRIAATIRLGLLLLVAAIGLEMTSPGFFQLGYGHGSVPYELEVVVEEGCELAGWLLIGVALQAQALDVVGALRAGAVQPARRELDSSRSFVAPSSRP